MALYLFSMVCVRLLGDAGEESKELRDHDGGDEDDTQGNHGGDFEHIVGDTIEERKRGGEERRRSRSPPRLPPLLTSIYACLYARLSICMLACMYMYVYLLFVCLPIYA